MSIDPSAPVNVLADRFWESLLELLPTTATMYGDDRYDDRLEDPGPEGRARARALSEATLAEAAAISLDGLSVEDRITLDMLRIVNELHVAGELTVGENVQAAARALLAASGGEVGLARDRMPVVDERGVVDHSTPYLVGTMRCELFGGRA